MPVSQSDRDNHISVLEEALALYETRDGGKYHGLWKDAGAKDNAASIKHKALRVGIMANEGSDPEQYIDDALDLINYCVFIVTNVREGRM